MNNRELDELIRWCKQKMEFKTKQCGYTGKRGEGYEDAMRAVMSHLHSLKKED